LHSARSRNAYINEMRNIRCMITFNLHMILII
jgi:hypothetical protein